MKTILLDTEGNLSVLDIESTLENYYSHLKCHTIDMVRRSIAGHHFSIVCDDEGLMIDAPIPTAVYADGSIAFCGNIMIEGMPDSCGNSTGLSDEDIIWIMKNIEELSFSFDGKSYHNKKLLIIDL